MVVEACMGENEQQVTPLLSHLGGALPIQLTQAHKHLSEHEHRSMSPDDAIRQTLITPPPFATTGHETDPVLTTIRSLTAQLTLRALNERPLRSSMEHAYRALLDRQYSQLERMAAQRQKR